MLQEYPAWWKQIEIGIGQYNRRHTGALNEDESYTNSTHAGVLISLLHGKWQKQVLIIDEQQPWGNSSFWMHTENTFIMYSAKCTLKKLDMIHAYTNYGIELTGINV